MAKRNGPGIRKGGAEGRGHNVPQPRSLRRYAGQAVRCVNCGCRLAPGERCDCERVEAERRAAEKAANTRRIVEHNLRMMEQAQLEYLYS